MAHDVFVSYSHGDKAAADAVVAGLEQRGIRCWIAPRDIMAGSNWGAAIVDAITEARAMVLMLSAESNGSRQVLREVERAVATETIVVPFRIEEVETTGAMSYFLGTEHWLDALTVPLEQHIERLSTTLHALLLTPLVGEPDDDAAASAASDAPPGPLPPPNPSSVANGPPEVPPPADTQPSRKWLWIGGGAVAAVMLVAVVVALASGGEGEESTATTVPRATTVTTVPITEVVTTPPEVVATTTVAEVITTTTMPATVATTAPATTTPPTVPPTIAGFDPGPAPAGLEWYDGSAHGFAIALPEDWLTVDLAEGDVDTLLDEMEGYLSQEMIGGIEAGLAAGVEIPMFSFAPSGDPNVNVSTVPLGPLDTLDILEATAADQFSGMPGLEFIGVERLQLSQIETVLIHTRGEFPDGTTDQFQYAVIDGRNGYIVTFTSLTGDLSDEFTELMDTFTLTD